MTPQNDYSPAPGEKEEFVQSRRNAVAKEPPEARRSAAACSDVWEYSQYRASLRRNGVTFALLTRDGKHSLNHEEQAVLLAALNRPNSELSNPPATAQSDGTES